MELSRREFGVIAAATGVSLILPAIADPDSEQINSVRYVHADARAGEWTRDEAEALARELAARYGLVLDRVSSLGSEVATAGYFVITAQCADNARVVVRTSDRDSHQIALIIRYRDGSAREELLDRPALTA
jgi:hypothetical protein